MSLRYAAILAPACAFTHPQQPRHYAIPPPYWLLWCNCVSFAWTIVLATLV